MRQRTSATVVALGGTLWLAACGGSSSPLPSGPTPPPPSGGTAVLVGAGDIADCANDGGRHAEDTAKLLDQIDGVVFTSGDNAYPTASASEFANCYGPRWGRHKSRTRPAAGNHEYETFPDAGPYYDYFGAAAGSRGRGFYSFTAGSWHIVVLNSNIPSGSGTEQWNWMVDDLTTSRAVCTAVIFHHPRFTSGPSGGGGMADAWRAMYDTNVDLVINGHDHYYERFAPQDPAGRRDDVRGIREIIVGTGGAPLYQAVRVQPNSELRTSTYGVVRLTLSANGYEWQFIEAGTAAVLDSGTGTCH